ncbi:hypothetical protein BPO_0366 [Bergeyella porcorum]|uniref:Integrase n=1 Tax=Bergeyella porcorum TaxID=1735111 RepID=A0AAU0F0S9_9FLAO
MREEKGNVSEKSKFLSKKEAKFLVEKLKYHTFAPRYIIII